MRNIMKLEGEGRVGKGRKKEGRGMDNENGY